MYNSIKKNEVDLCSIIERFFATCPRRDGTKLQWFRRTLRIFEYFYFRLSLPRQQISCDKSQHRTSVSICFANAFHLKRVPFARTRCLCRSNGRQTTCPRTCILRGISVSADNRLSACTCFFHPTTVSGLEFCPRIFHERRTLTGCDTCLRTTVYQCGLSFIPHKGRIRLRERTNRNA